jgi:3-oxoacyl-[acyl-carrier protein] reductase
MTMFDLKNKKILVTGASRGIGEAIANQMGKLGGKVAIHFGKSAKNAENLALELNNGSFAIGADLANSKEVEDLFLRTVEQLDGLDILVNNAGIAIGSPENLSNEQWMKDWEQTMMVNVSASALLGKMAIDHFQKSGGGKIINIASRAAFRGDTADYMAYAASKGAMVALTRSIARAYGKQNIQAFIIAPGFTRTDMAQDFMDQYGEEYALNDIALNKLTEPKDIAPMVAFLASGLADHATGCTIDINAGSYVH